MQYAIIEIEYNDMTNQYGYVEKSQKTIVVKEISPNKDLLTNCYGPYKAVIPVFDYMDPGYILSYLDMIRIRATFKTNLKGIQGHPTRSHINPSDKLPVFTKEEKGILALGNFKISPGLIITYEEYQDDTIDIYQVGHVKGFKGLKGVTRAKREVVYLSEEMDTLNERISKGTYPIISPDGITTGYEVRPEVPLIPDPIQVKEPQEKELIEECTLNGIEKAIKPFIDREIAMVTSEILREISPYEEIAIMNRELQEINLISNSCTEELLSAHDIDIEKEFFQDEYQEIEYPGEIEELNKILLEEYLSDKLKSGIIPIVPSKQAPKLPVQNICEMWKITCKMLPMSSGIGC